MGQDDERSLFVEQVQAATKTFESGGSKATFMQPVTASVARWTVRVDMQNVKTGRGGEGGPETEWGTRLRVRFPTVDGFTFDVQPLKRGWIRSLVRGRVTPPIKVGDRDFDAAFAVRSNDNVKLRALLSIPQVRDRILRTVNADHRSLQLKRGRRLRPGPPNGVSELRFEQVGFPEQEGFPEDEGTLTMLYDLFAEVLDALWRDGTVPGDSQDVGF